MLAIRMRRLGAKKRPFFRVVVIDSHAAREGRALEVLGHYNPTTVPETFQMDHQRLEHWLTCGAQPSDTLRTLLTRHPAGEAAEEAASATPPTPPPPAQATPEVEAPEPNAAAATGGDAVKSTEAPSVDEVTGS
jgi:small subunit ribosomal protein S16